MARLLQAGIKVASRAGARTIWAQVSAGGFEGRSTTIIRVLCGLSW